MSSPRECPHKHEVSQSGLSSPSCDSNHVTLSHQVAVQQWRYTHRTLATPVVATASAVLRAALFPIMENLENALSETSTLSLDCVFCVWLVNSWEHMYVSTGYSYLVIFMLSSTR